MSLIASVQLDTTRLLHWPSLAQVVIKPLECASSFHSDQVLVEVAILTTTTRLLEVAILTVVRTLYNTLSRMPAAKRQSKDLVALTHGIVFSVLKISQACQRCQPHCLPHGWQGPWR